MPRPAFEAFVAPARRRPQIWRLLAGSVAIAAIYLALLAAVFGAVALVLGVGPAFDLAARLVRPATPGASLVLLASFVAMAVAPMLTVRLLHARGPATLFGRAPRVLRDFVVTALVAGVFYAVMLGFWALLYDAEPNLPTRRWAVLLPLTVLGLLVQTGAEELIFRGYLTQQAAARFRSPLVWMALPALLFGAAHWDPSTAGQNALLIVAGATLFGLAAADLTAATGSLGAAWGFHFANNFVAIGVLATDGTITGLALWTTPYAVDHTGPMRWVFLGDLVLLGATWGLCRLALRR